MGVLRLYLVTAVRSTSDVVDLWRNRRFGRRQPADLTHLPERAAAAAGAWPLADPEPVDFRGGSSFEFCSGGRSGFASRRYRLPSESDGPVGREFTVPIRSCPRRRGLGDGGCLLTTYSPVGRYRWDVAQQAIFPPSGESPEKWAGGMVGSRSPLEAVRAGTTKLADARLAAGAVNCAGLGRRPAAAPIRRSARDRSRARGRVRQFIWTTMVAARRGASAGHWTCRACGDGNRARSSCGRAGRCRGDTRLAHAAGNVGAADRAAHRGDPPSRRGWPRNGCRAKIGSRPARD